MLPAQATADDDVTRHQEGEIGVPDEAKAMPLGLAIRSALGMRGKGRADSQPGRVRLAVRLASAQETLGVRCATSGGCVTVASVVPGGPAEGAGLRVGDVVVRVGGVPVAAPRDVVTGVAAAVRTSPGAPHDVMFEVKRGIDRGDPASSLSPHRRSPCLASPRDQRSMQLHRLKAALAGSAITRSTYDEEVTRLTGVVVGEPATGDALGASVLSAPSPPLSDTSSERASLAPSLSRTVIVSGGGQGQQMRAEQNGQGWAAPPSRFRRFKSARVSSTPEAPLPPPPAPASAAADDPEPPTPTAADSAAATYAFDLADFSNLSAEALDSLRQLFIAADADHDGLLSAAEITNCLVKLGMSQAHAAEAVHDAMQRFDGDGNGLIDFAEWLQWHTGGGREAVVAEEEPPASAEEDGNGGGDEERKGGEAVEEGAGKEGRPVLMTAEDFMDYEFPDQLLADLQSGFAKMDDNGDGVVTEAEIYAYLESHGYDDAEVIAKALMAQADKDNSGEISYVEFISNALNRGHK